MLLRAVFIECACSCLPLPAVADRSKRAPLTPELGRSGGLLRLDVLGDIGAPSSSCTASRCRLHLLAQGFTFVVFPQWWCLLNPLLGRFVPHDLLLPYALGQALRPWLGAWFKRIKPITNVVDRGVIVLLVCASFSDSVADGLWARHGLGLIGMTLAGVVLFLFPVLWLSRRVARALGFTVEDEIVAVFCGSKKTMASGVPMARVLFGGDPALGVLVMPILFYHQLQLFVGSVLARRYAQRPEALPNPVVVATPAQTA